MNHWVKTAEFNLLQHSVNQSGYAAAKNEWRVGDQVIDNYGDDADFTEDSPSCELCEHEDLRWQFEIINRENNNKLLVGSTCIKQFDIAIVNADKTLILGEDRDKVLQKRIDEQKKENNYNELLEKLRILWKKDLKNRKKIEEIAKRWKVEKKFDPRDGYFIRFRLNLHGMPLDRCRMEISLRSTENKMQVVQMTKDEISILEEVLTSAQKKAVSNLLVEYKHYRERTMKN